MTGKPPLVRVIHHAYPVVPQPHTWSALLTYVRYRFGIILPKMFTEDDVDRHAGFMLGSYLEREARLNRIAAVYPAAAAEARLAGKRKGAHL